MEKLTFHLWQLQPLPEYSKMTMYYFFIVIKSPTSNSGSSEAIEEHINLTKYEKKVHND